MGSPVRVPMRQAGRLKRQRLMGKPGKLHVMLVEPSMPEPPIVIQGLEGDVATKFCPKPL